MAVGEKLWEQKGRITGMTIKSVGVEGVNTESNWVAEVKGFGRLEGSEFKAMGTSIGWRRPDGITGGTGQGVSTSKEGETILWKGYSMGRIEAGKNKTVTLITFQTSSQKRPWMNSLVTLYEGETTPEGEMTGTGYEWK